MTRPRPGISRAALRGIARAWLARSRWAWTDVPIPWRLPFGGWFLAHGDLMGLNVAAYRFTRAPFENATWRYVERQLGAGMTFIDVGANQGFYALLAAKKVGREGRVIAFEPAPRERERLERNLRLNGHRNVRVEPWALGDAAANAPLYVCLGAEGALTSLRPPTHDTPLRQVVLDVPITTLDAYASSHTLPRVDMIKLDIEGGELAALRGARATIETHRPIIVAEIEAKRTHPWGHTPADVFAFLSSLGYDLFEPCEAGLTPLVERPGRSRDIVAIPRRA